nr:hypothetical protein [uncultured Desulfobacter sp.]
MASNDYKRMIKLGEWLETYLNPEIKAKEYRSLAKTFIKLYNVNFDLKVNDLTIKYLELMENQNENIKKFYIDIHDGPLVGAPEKDPLLLIMQDKDPLEIKNRFKMLFFDNEKFPFLTIPNPSEKILNDTCINIIEGFVYFALRITMRNKEKKDILSCFLKRVNTPKTCWQKSLFAAGCDRKYLSIYFFRDNYSKLVDTCFINEDKGEISFQKGFSILHKDLSNFDWKTISVFQWDIALARVFFDFLLLGGQNHIHFCKQCGRFTVIKRRGRKEYCSSLCRVRASNERIAQAGA